MPIPTVTSIEALRRDPTVVLFEGGDEIPASRFVTENVRGEGPPLHVHPYAEVFLVQTGTATFTVADGRVDVSGGDVVVVPAQTPHGYRSPGADVLPW